MSTSPIAEKIKVLRLKSEDYLATKNFPRNIPNKPHPPENPAHHYLLPIKMIPPDFYNKYEIQSATKEHRKKTPMQFMPKADNYQKQNMEEETSKLLAIRQNLIDSLDEIKFRSVKKERDNDVFLDPPSSEKIKRSGLKSSHFAVNDNQASNLENDLALERQKNSELNRQLMDLSMKIRSVEDEKRDLINELSRFRNVLAGMRDTKVNETDYSLTLQDSEKKIRILSDELERMRGIQKSWDDNRRAMEEKLVSTTTEIHRLTAALRLKQDQIVDLEGKIQFSNIPKSDTRPLDEKIVILTTEMQRLKSINAQKQDTIHDFDMKNRANEDKISYLTSENRGLSNKISDMEVQLKNSRNSRADMSPIEEKLALLATENQRLSALLGMKQDAIKDLEFKLKTIGNLPKEDKKALENKIASLSDENQRLNELLGVKQDAINDLEARIRMTPGISSDMRNLEEKVALLSTEIQRLNGMIGLKQTKIYELESSVRSLLAGIENVKNLENKLALITVENQRLLGQLDGKREEVADLERKLAFLESKVREYDSRTGNSDELIKIRNTLTEINRLYEDLKAKYERMEREFLIKIRELEQKYNDKEKESINNINILRNNEQELNDLRNENRSFRAELDEIHNDHNDKLQRMEKAKKSNMDAEKNKLASEFQNEKDSWIREKEGLLKDLDRLGKDRNFQIGELRKNLLLKEDEIAELEKRKLREIEKMRGEFDELNRRKLEEPIRDATMKLNAEIENLERQLKNYKQTILELENKISLLIKENERISVAYDQKMKEIDILNYRAQNQERVRAQELEQLRNEMEKRSMDNFEMKIQDIKYQYENEKNNLIAEIKEFQQKCNNYENKISFFTIEIERLNGIIMDKQDEIDDFKAKFKDMNMQFMNLRDLHLVSHADVKIGAEQAKSEVEVKYLQQKIKDMDEENTHLKKQLDDYKSFNNRRMLELGEWKERISNGNLLDNPEDLKKSYEDYLRLKKDLQEMGIQKKMDAENFDHRIKESNIALESKKNELNELMRLLNNEKEERKKTQIQLENLRNELSNSSNTKIMMNYARENTDSIKIENGELKRQIAELQNKMMTLREDVGKKNDILSQRIVEMESAKRKFEEELKKFNSKNPNTEEYTIYSTTSRFV